jgi:hypothetical protein
LFSRTSKATWRTGTSIGMFLTCISRVLTIYVKFVAG